ncbi:protein-methionine-sulfoxide reductase heme-binding subunit MsrQ [Sulfitobacter sp. JBTF-M27]|uniref:Protein-methionine-sulfoxide reductase heme-binding subunit MsrQ n=1 Tax=Sulfitobacter sediminilitoris TaxID=2698830 RepID=A0A6P0C9C1_9RHOB|nr:protein-methionine-sulfoxide reductase heme-binding subunit MsrQ [Sulfitobacter sediminilitoris]NEK22799.1 protein-methionine-sulfoxide reductase heme-binding subunit MsrQ [Sulfitobacter sediminilitoris]
MSIVERINTTARRIPTWAVYILYILPAPYFFYLALTGGLGPDPVKPLEHEYGEIALQLLIIGLCVTPLRRFFGINLVKFRRTFGMLAFTYVTLHLLVWAFLDVQTLDRVIADIIKRPYITIGMAGFLLLLPLAITSNNWSVRKLGPKWRQLHKLTYAAVILGGVHYIWLVKGIQLEPLIYMAVILGLLALRLRKSRSRVRLPG